MKREMTTAEIMVKIIDYQILLEADYLVNADESKYSAAHVENTREKLFKTSTGIALLCSVYQNRA